MWGVKQPNAVRDLYFPGAVLHAPGGRGMHGHGEIDRFVIGYLASFPDARFALESAMVNRDAEQPVRIALRWSLTGRHAGFGHFGPPTGAPVYVMAMSHVHMTQGMVRAEWLAIDEVAIWKQILAHGAG